MSGDILISRVERGLANTETRFGSPFRFEEHFLYRLFSTHLSLTSIIEGWRTKPEDKARELFPGNEEGLDLVLGRFLKLSIRL